LVDLAESGSPVTLHVRAGRVHHGLVRMVGRDFVVLGRDEAPDLVVAVVAICAVRARGDQAIVAGARELVTGRTLVQLLDGLCGRRERVLLVTDDGGCTVAGTLWSLGRDMVMVRSDADNRSAAYLPLAAICEIVLG
jgi:hypothetical protein